MVLVLVADNAIAQKLFRAFFQNFDNWTIQNSYKMSVSPASSKSIGWTLGSFLCQNLI